MSQPCPWKPLGVALSETLTKVLRITSFFGFKDSAKNRVFFAHRTPRCKSICLHLLPVTLSHTCGIDTLFCLPWDTYYTHGWYARPG